jgi:aspartyl-tRNA synthetase
MHVYRTHTCNALTAAEVGREARLSGWVHRKRDHGNLLFIDLRDHYGITQCVIDTSSPLFKAVEAVRVESVVTITGKVVNRPAETVNRKLATGEIEVQIGAFTLQSTAEVLPLQVASDEDSGEEVRLRYRFLDLRRDKVHRNIVLRSQVIQSIRRRMIEQRFTEFQTPILTSSSPEGARDFLVPARLHPGKFYALPQAPQQFKQLLMVAASTAISRSHPASATRTAARPQPRRVLPARFRDVVRDPGGRVAAIGPVLHGVFEEFAGVRQVTPPPFPRIAYDDALRLYGSDKPDLRNPILIADVTEAFRGSGFGIFAKQVEQGGIVRAIPAPGAAAKPRSFFDKLNEWAREQGAAGLGYISFAADGPKGPIAKNLDEGRLAAIRTAAGIKDGTRCSSPATRRRRPRNSRASCATSSGRNSTSTRRTPSASLDRRFPDV